MALDGYSTAMQAKDAQGHLVTKSDTPFAVRVCCGDQEIAGDVVEEGEGVSWVTYTMNSAGPLTLEAILPGASGARTFQAVCAPDVMSLGHSVLLSPSAQDTAGQPCSLVIKQHDR
ncbi:MAG: hypothetical protein MMC33_008457 [Icmadophila ericetorum]|nr:hypothetical protein [Icmadophila ericetorum]